MPEPYRMESVSYAGPLWEGSLPHADLLKLLSAKDVLITLRSGNGPPAVALGVPHQAAIGVDRIAGDWIRANGQAGRASDEGAALFALAAYERLRQQGTPCALAIAAHATDHDPNKALDSPYCRAIFGETPLLLFECHGAGRARAHALELSAGRNHLSAPLRFGELLARALGWRYVVAAQCEPGQARAIAIHGEEERRETSLSLPALGTGSLAAAGERGLHALHLEARPAFRITTARPNALPAAGRRLGNAIAEACIAYLGEIRS